MIIFSILYLQIQNTHDQNSKKVKAIFLENQLLQQCGFEWKEKTWFHFFLYLQMLFKNVSDISCLILSSLHQESAD